MKLRYTQAPNGVKFVVDDGWIYRPSMVIEAPPLGILVERDAIPLLQEEEAAKLLFCGQGGRWNPGQMVLQNQVGGFEETCSYKIWSMAEAMFHGRLEIAYPSDATEAVAKNLYHLLESS